MSLSPKEVEDNSSSSFFRWWNMKKIILFLMTINVIFYSLVSMPIANASEVATTSLVTKPVTMAAKKAAKDVAKNTAVEMANQIVAEFLVKELIEGVETDKGYKAVCMDGPKDNIKDCPSNKRAQIKSNLSASDKSKLADKVEDVLEKKTLTSSKWGKFLDFFVPLFLVSGAVSIIGASMDGDMLSFFDEIAQDSLIELGFLKPLHASINGEGAWNPKDFTQHVKSVSVDIDTKNGTPYLRLTVVPHPNQKLILHHNGYKKTISTSTKLSIISYAGYARQDRNIYAFSRLDTFFDGSNSGDLKGFRVFTGGMHISDGSQEQHDMLVRLAQNSLTAHYTSYWISPQSDVNSILNQFFGTLSQFFTIDIEVPNSEQPPVQTDYGKQSATDKIKNPDGTVNIKGQDSFTFTYGDIHVYPSDQSTTGWKDKTTGEDVTVVEDDIVVTDKTEDLPTEPEDKPEFSCDRELELPTLKPIGNAFTHAFPFSIPWDIKRFIDNAFGGVNSERPSYDLTFLGDGVVLEIPAFFDNWMPFIRGLLVFVFDISVLFLFYRFMKGGGD